MYVSFNCLNLYWITRFFCFAGSSMRSFDSYPMDIKSEPITDPVAFPESNCPPEPINSQPSAVITTKPADIDWLHQMPAVYEKIFPGELKFNAIMNKSLRKTGIRPTCDICQVQRDSRKRMLEHMAMHIDARSYKCHLCPDKAYNTKKLLWLHIKHMHLKTDVPRLKCGDCDASFRTEFNLKCHRRTHTGERPFSCDQCDDRFYTRQTMRKHIRRHNVEQQPADVGQPESARKLALRWVDAMEEVEDELPADEKYFTYTLLKQLRQGRKGRTIECDICGSLQESRRRMFKHMAMHINAKKFRCILCDGSYNTKILLRLHVKHMHLADKTVPSEEVACDLCGAQFRTAALRNAHRHIHTRQPNWKCLQCDKAFMQKRSLDEHMRCHELVAVNKEGGISLDWTWIDALPEALDDQSFGERQFSQMLMKRLRTGPRGARWIECDICGSMQESR